MPDLFTDQLVVYFCRKMNKDVLFVYSPMDDFVMTNVAEFNGRKVISAEHAKINVDSDGDSTSEKKLSKDEQQLFEAWLKLTLEDSVKEVKVCCCLLLISCL